jgi:hypothetical protein
MFTVGSQKVALVVLAVLATKSSGFSPQATTIARKCLNKEFRLHQTSDDERSSQQQRQRQSDTVEVFMEYASQNGADKVRSMSTEERTRRAMLAEAVEDRIYTMYDEMEGLLTDGVPANEADREEIRSLAEEIKASQSRYQGLVAGEPSITLGTINEIGSPSKPEDNALNG